ncbi:hypothetical protein MMPV_001207 [Pyropia vietnamensis]
MGLRMPSTGQQEVVLRSLILALICAVAFSTRLFSVLRYESIIHEFDPWFNFRATRVLVERGSYDFWNWFDGRSWYPLGRIVGGTVYPGIMYTAATMYHALHAFGFNVDIRDVCVLTAPFFSGLTALAAYALTQSVADTSAGLLAATFISIVPGYISRSVAGSYDNEGVAITALLVTFWLFVRAVKTGSLLASLAATLSYLYMVAAWGGYIFIINLVPVYVLVMLAAGRYSRRLYIAYNTFYVLGTLLSMQIRFVGFNAVQSSEHLGAFGVFGLINLYAAVGWVRSFTSERVFRAVGRLLVVTALAIAGVAAFFGTVTGYIGPWTGRFYSLLDPTYASKNIPIIASVSEHQPTAWGSYFFDLHALTFLTPVGLYFCFRNPTDENLFIIVYGAFAIYFSGVMVRLMLVLAPVAAILSAIGVSATLSTYMRVLRAPPAEAVAAIVSSAPARTAVGEDVSGAESVVSSATSPQSGLRHRAGAQSSSSPSTATSSGKRSKPPGSQARRRRVAEDSGSPSPSPSGSSFDSLPPTHRRDVAAIMVLGTIVLLILYVRHCVWVTSEAYSSPSVVLSARGRDGERIFFDDYREAYYWLRQNTPEDAKVMSWWDYGYQLSGMANRTTIVDNNTWNNSHIATVGRAMNAPEPQAYAIARKLDVDYVLVIFGGVVGYSSDDINKFLWMVRIPGSVDPSVHEKEYLSTQGSYVVDSRAGKALKKSLLYKLCYYRFDEMSTVAGQPPGFDRVRNAVVGVKDIKLKYFEEAFTSENWIVRLYRVKKPDDLGWM